MDSMPDPTFSNADTDDAKLENFFSRPIKVLSFTWAPGSGIFQTFNPWQDFFENPRIINRITNYNLLRCKLKCKIILNGNGFYFGRAIAAYQPLHNLDGFTVNRQFFPEDIIAASQRPHVYLDPTNSQGGTLTLPFFWYENALRIPSQEWREMGQVNIRSIQNLKHANGSTDTITVSVFVWAEEVSLSIPTANEPAALTPQMGEKTRDEYSKDGIISKPAGFVAKVAGALSNIAPIAPYAKATQMAASTVSNVAAMFGFSRPAVLQDIQPYRPTYLGNMVNTNVPDSVTKLTLDAKQETTIDPRVMGLGSDDEMTIKSVACRESYLTNFMWAQASAAETLLWNSEVSPVLWGASFINTEIHLPACAFAAIPFKHWRGTMKFRFQIVASAFHKGRLKITYDPSYPLTNEYNTNYTHIVDLAKERDFTIDIGWGQERSMVGHRNPTTDSVPYKATALGADPGINANGIISVYVVNELTTPNVTPDNDVQVNVFVSMGDDFEVFNPDSEIIEDLVFFEPQVGQLQTIPEDREINITDKTRIMRKFLRRVYSNRDLFRKGHFVSRKKFSAQAGERCESLSPFSQLVLSGSALLTAITFALYAYVRHTLKRDESRRLSPMTAQMAETTESHPDADRTTAENEPMKLVASDQKGATMTDTDHTVSVFYGDPITSFRQCLKRYNYHSSWMSDEADNFYFDCTTYTFPTYRGYAPDAVHSCNVPVYPTPYNYVKTTLLNYVTAAYGARRGAIRWKYLRMGGSTDDLFYVCRTSNPGASAQFVTNRLSNVGAASTDKRYREAMVGIEHMWDGAHATVPSQNPVLEVEFPWYSNCRFYPGKDSSPNSPDAPMLGDNHLLGGTWTQTATDKSAIHNFVSIGEDYTLGFFLGCPRVYFVSANNDPDTT